MLDMDYYTINFLKSIGMAAGLVAFILGGAWFIVDLLSP